MMNKHLPLGQSSKGPKFSGDKLVSPEGSSLELLKSEDKLDKGHNKISTAGDLFNLMDRTDMAGTYYVPFMGSMCISCSLERSIIPRMQTFKSNPKMTKDPRIRGINQFTLEYLMNRYSENLVPSQYSKDIYSSVRATHLIEKSPNFLKLSIRMIVKGEFWSTSITLMNELSELDYKLGNEVIRIAIYEFNGSRFIKLLISDNVDEIAIIRLDYVFGSHSVPIDDTNYLVSEEFYTFITDEEGRLLYES